MERLRLRAISFVDFRFSEATHYQEWAKRNGSIIGRGDAVLFVSHTRKQLVFIIGDSTQAAKGFKILDSRRWRLTQGTWNPEMLQDYAHSVGIHLIGIRSFKEIHEARIAEKRT